MLGIGRNRAILYTQKYRFCSHLILRNVDIVIFVIGGLIVFTVLQPIISSVLSPILSFLALITTGVIIVGLVAQNSGLVLAGIVSIVILAISKAIIS